MTKLIKKQECLTETINGWVIYSPNHPATNSTFFHSSTFRPYRKEAIADFINGSGANWKYWYRKYNFRFVKATQSVTILG